MWPSTLDDTDGPPSSENSATSSLPSHRPLRTSSQRPSSTTTLTNHARSPMDGHHYYGNATQVCTFIYGLFTYKAPDHTPCPLPKDIRFS
jgi:hypothetical protein